jgi:DNA-binding transcriptional ArsR family regulator
MMHPVRRRILSQLEAYPGPLEPIDFSMTTDQSLSVVGYHLRELERVGWLEGPVANQPRVRLRDAVRGELPVAFARAALTDSRGKDLSPSDPRGSDAT